MLITYIRTPIERDRYCSHFISCPVSSKLCFGNIESKKSGKPPNNLKSRKKEILVVSVDYFSVNTCLKNEKTEATKTEKKMAVLQGKCFLPVDTAENIQN